MYVIIQKPHRSRIHFLIFFFFRAALLASLILFTHVMLKQLHPSVFVARKRVDLGFFFFSLSASLSIYPPLSRPRLPISPCYLLTPSLTTYPSLRAARGINISCSACLRGYTSPLYWRPIGALLQLWPPTSQPCSGQSALAPLSDAAGVAANSWPW